jgi:hypothetical protein
VSSHGIDRSGPHPWTAREALAASLSALQDRLLRELARGAASGVEPTVRVGGITKTSAALDQMWLALWTYACVLTSDEPSQQTVTSSGIPAAKATAGQLARTLAHRLARHELALREPFLSALAEGREPSHTLRFIALRNDVVHGRTAVDESALRAAYEGLLTVVRRMLAALEG